MVFTGILSRTTVKWSFLLSAHLHGGYRRVVYGYDAVARHDAHFLGRAFRHGLYHEQRVFLHVELYADTLE